MEVGKVHLNKKFMLLISWGFKKNKIIRDLKYICQEQKLNQIKYNCKESHADK